MTLAKIIIAEGLVKRFGSVTAVSNFFSVEAGRIYCSVGPNGAGKTTTLRIVVGLLKPEAGRALIEGYDIQRDRVEDLRRVGYVPNYPNPQLPNTA